MDFVETHAHLDSRTFDADRDDVIRRALDAGIGQIITVGADLGSSRAAISLAERYANVYATVGVHPHEAKSVNPPMLDALRELATHPRVVAVGEIGLDFYRDFSPQDAQRAAFEAQLALAVEANKPVVVHIRDRKDQTRAYDEALSILRSWLPNHVLSQSPGPGVLHCFSGALDYAHQALDLGFYLGVDGPVTFPNAKQLQAVVAQLPLERLLLETDCPYLAPQPRRGKRNEPAYLPHIAHKVAECQGIAVEKVARVTTDSAIRLFRLSQDLRTVPPAPTCAACRRKCVAQAQAASWGREQNSGNGRAI